MIRGHAINLLHIFDVPQKFKVMSLMVETIKRTAADQKRSCGYAPHIQELINSKMGKGKYILDKEPIVCDMRWVDWTYMKENEEHYPGVYDSSSACGLADFVGQKLTN